MGAPAPTRRLSRVRPLRVVVLLAALAVAVWAFVSRPQLPAAERGRRLAQSLGCFGCHGDGGLHGAANPGRADRSVPAFANDIMMYAKTAADVRAWIADGAPERRRASVTWRAQRELGALKMPAFGRRLASGQLDDLVAYVMAVSASPPPGDSLAAAGLARADGLGCTGCHGAGGRLALPNRGSLKGYVPSWDGRDFPELVRDSVEFGQWVRRGVSARFAANPLAAFFLHRASLHMPPYEKHLAPGDLGALWAYVNWLRATDPSPPETPVRQR